MDMEGTSRLKIFTGTAHPALAKEISDYIGVPLGKSMTTRKKLAFASRDLKMQKTSVSIVFIKGNL